MSIHKECGENVRWVKGGRRKERFMPPLEFVGNYTILVLDDDGDEVGTDVACYQVHTCDPDKMLAWRERLARVKEIKDLPPILVEADRPLSNWKIARERDQENARAAAEKRDCTTCGAIEGEFCFNLSIFKRTHEKVPTNMPHASRIDYTKDLE